MMGTHKLKNSFFLFLVIDYNRPERPTRVCQYYWYVLIGVPSEFG